MTLETAGTAPVCRTTTLAPARPRRPRAAWPWLLVLAALGACSGDDNPPAAQASATADSASVAWNEASTLAVTSNDTIANGTASIAVTTAPAHGTATVSGTSITYTPAAGYFGPDALRYTLTVGNATSQADVAVDVTAKLTLSGVVSDGPLPGASVVATVGTATLPAVTADAGGAYQLSLETSDPTAFISLKAQGAGAQSHVVLTSLVSDARTAATAAASGAVSASALPALDVTHLSTAVAALTRQALGKAPASSAEVASVQGLFTPDQVIEMAAAIKLVVDQGVALPEGSADTLALVSDAGAYKTFVLAQVAADPAAFSQAQQAVLADPLLAVAPAVPSPGGAATTMLVVRGQGASVGYPTRLILQADGTARVESGAITAATWQLIDKDVVVSFTPPNRVTGYGDVDPVTGQQSEVEYRDTGLVVRQLAGSAGVSIQSVSEFEYLDGSLKGTVVKNENLTQNETLVSALGQLTAADLAPGTRWAGVPDTRALSDPAADLDQDILRIVDDSTARFERSGRAGTWRLVGGSLELTVDGAVFTYSRLFLGPRGEERWLAEKRVDAKLVWVLEPSMFKAQDAAAFTTAGLAQKWESYINVGVTSSRFFVTLAADGTSSETTAEVGKPESVRNTFAWTLGEDGQMVQSRIICESSSAPCASLLRRAWQPIATVGDRLYVMEHRIIDPETNTGAYRLNVYIATP